MLYLSGFHPKRWTEFDCQPNTPPRLPPRFYLNHTPTLRFFNHLKCRFQAPETNPATIELPALADVSINRVSSLSGIIPKAAIVRNAVRRSQFPQIDFRLRNSRFEISGDRTWKHPLTHRLKLFAVWHRLPVDSLASPRGPFMVELFAACFHRTPGTTMPDSDCHQSKTPHASQVERSLRHSVWKTHEPPEQDCADTIVQPHLL